MVANISSHKAGWDSRWKEFSTWAVKGMALQSELLSLVDEDTKAFNRILEAFGLPKDTEADKATRKAAIQDATRGAIEVPLKVMRKSYESFEIIKAMVLEGNPNSVTDAGVGALCARTAVKGAFLNVKINASGLEDKEFVKQVMEEGSAIEARAVQLEEEIMELVQGKIGH
jgi:glutamate formiminotransferase/formiminotetrahydrofolate cyclodeaminase